VQRCFASGSLHHVLRPRPSTYGYGVGLGLGL
jgi:hypothetical protein